MIWVYFKNSVLQQLKGSQWSKLGMWKAPHKTFVGPSNCPWVSEDEQCNACFVNQITHHAGEGNLGHVRVFTNKMPKSQVLAVTWQSWSPSSSVAIKFTSVGLLPHVSPTYKIYGTSASFMNELLYKILNNYSSSPKPVRYAAGRFSVEQHWRP